MASGLNHSPWWSSVPRWVPESASLRVAVQQRDSILVTFLCMWKRSVLEVWNEMGQQQACYSLGLSGGGFLALGHIFLTAVEGGFLVPSIFKTQSSFWTLMETLQKPESWAHWRREERRGKTTLYLSFDFETCLRKAALLVVK